MKNPLLDPVFLKQLDKDNEKEVYAKIISLTQDEQPLESIEGKVTKGTINIDGSSSVKRTCNLTLIAQEVNITDIYWGLTNKFKLEIGLTNRVDSSYDEIIWFPQGMFAINTFKTSYAAKGFNITIGGQDKMCFLSGDLGGKIPAATDFAYEELILEDGSIQKNYLPIKHIIREMVHYYGNEPFHNIIIKDVDDMGLEQLDYLGENSIYIFRTEDGDYTNMLFDGNVTRYEKATNLPIKINDTSKMIYYSLAANADNTRATWVKADQQVLSQAFQVVKCQPGEASGYRMIDLIWPEKDGLIAQAGETVTSVLDKICKQFGDYEYFYDLDGHFVFQKKLTYVNTSWNNLITVEGDESYIESDKLVSQYSYDFSDNILIQSFNNTPDFKNLKNDFTIWGKKKSSSNSSSSSNKGVNDPLAIHLRYAIHEKPQTYTDYAGTTWESGDRIKITFDDFASGPKTEIQETVVDWRELIYLMAVDYFAHNHDDDFAIQIARRNPQYPFGKTGYEQYYTDMLQFWRYLYNPFTDDNVNYFVGALSEAEIENFGWNRIVIDNPSQLKFWIDFLDPQGGALSKYSVSAIGSRAQVVNEDAIRAIVYKEIPSLIYVTQEKYNELEESNLLLSGYTYVKIPESFEEYFQRSVQSKTAQQKLDELLYKHAYINEKISVKAIPIYYLQPNTKVFIQDESSKIYGEYIINKISLTLGHKGMMSINASRAPVRLY